MENAEKLLIEQLKRGEERSYKYIYDNHYVFLCHIANAYVNDHYVAETIVGDVIFHIWEIRETLEITVSIRAYLVQAVRNRSINYISSLYREHKVPLSDLNAGNMQIEREYLLSADYPLGTLLEHELEGEITKAINRLPQECKIVFQKSRFEGKKYSEIADDLGISVNTVKYHLKRALASLHKDLGKYLKLFIFFS